MFSRQSKWSFWSKFGHFGSFELILVHIGSHWTSEIFLAIKIFFAMKLFFQSNPAGLAKNNLIAKNDFGRNVFLKE